MSIDKHIKILKYIMYFLLIISLIFGVIDKVKADTCNNIYNGNIESTNPSMPITTSAGVGRNYVDTKFNTTTIPSGTEYIKGTLWVSILQTQNTITSNIDITKTCGGTTFNYDIVDHYIYYQDGSTAEIMGDTKKYWCNQWASTGNITTTNQYEPFIQNIEVSMYYYKNGDTYNYRQKCDTDINGNFKCYVKDAVSYNGFRFYVVMSKGASNIRLSLLDNYMGYCSTDTQAIINNNNQNTNTINNSIQDTNNTLKDSSIDTNNTSSSTSNWGNMSASNGVITNLLTLPIQLMQGYVNGLNSSCTPFNLGNLFGTNITLPCINIGNLIGSALWGVIDVLFSGFMIFGIAKKLIKIFNDFTNMRGNQVDELYGGGA